MIRIWLYENFSRKLDPHFLVQSLFDKSFDIFLVYTWHVQSRQYAQDSKTINNRSLDGVMNNPINLSY